MHTASLSDVSFCFSMIAAFATVNQTVTAFHRHVVQPTRVVAESLRCNGRVAVRWHDYASVTILVPVLMPVMGLCRGKTLTHKRLDLEARVGIGQAQRALTC